MNLQLSEDPISCVRNFVVAPGAMLSGRGNILVYLNDMVIHVLEGNLMLHRVSSILQKINLFVCFDVLSLCHA